MKRFLCVLLLLAACSRDSTTATTTTQPAPTTTAPPACRTALDLFDAYTVARAGGKREGIDITAPNGVLTLCRNDPATTASCIDAMTTAGRLSTATGAGFTEAANQYRAAATACRSKLN